MEGKQKVNAMLVDLKNASDCVDSEEILNTLKKSKIGEEEGLINSVMKI